MAKRTFKPVKELEKEYFPAGILDRLDQTLCSYLNLDKEHQHLVSKDEKNPKLGHIEAARPGFYSRKDLEQVIKNFYKQEGYRVMGTETPGMLEVKKQKENYKVSISEWDSLLLVTVSKAPRKPKA